MREMKDSGVEWIGEIPKDWKICKIKNIAQIYTGNSIRDEEKGKYENSDNARPYIATKDIDVTLGTTNYENGLYIKKNDLSFKVACKGSTLMCIEGGSAGKKKTYLLHNVSFGNKLCCFYSEIINKTYLYFFLSSPNFEMEFANCISGLIGGVSVSVLKNMAFLIPSKENQQCIANILKDKCSKIDAIITRKQAVIEKLKEYKQILISEAIRHGIHGEELQLSRYFWIDSIPRSWKVGQLKYFATIRSGITMGKKYPNNSKLVDIPYLRVANVQGEYVDLSDIATISVLPEEVEKYCLKADELLMTEGGDRDKLGRGCVWKGEINPCLHQNHVFAVSTDNSRLLVHFLDYVTTSDIARSYFEYTAKKTTNLASTNSTTILQFRIPIPPVAEQQEIVDYLNTRCTKINQLIKGCKIIIDKLTEYKKSFIYEVVTGKKEV